MGKIKNQKTLPFTCPICGRKAEHPLDALREGEELTCPFCKLKLILHGHMWQEVQQELAKIEAGGKDKGSSKES